MQRYMMTWLLHVLAVTGNGASVFAAGVAIENDKLKVSGEAGKKGNHDALLWTHMQVVCMGAVLV